MSIKVDKAFKNNRVRVSVDGERLDSVSTRLTRDEIRQLRDELNQLLECKCDADHRSV